MHTATRIAFEALPRIKRLAPRAHLAAYGLYAPVNAARLREQGVASIFGGEFEPQLLALAEGLADSGEAPPAREAQKVHFVVPDRSGLPALERYAHLDLPDGGRRVVGFAEGTRGCKHLCRHCPVVPVYEGRFRAVPLEVVMADIRQQVAAGAEHISFGDPDFLNGPTHALRLARALHAELPHVSYDATIKIEHLIDHADLLPELGDTGCVLITSAVESIDDRVLGYLDKGHTRADFERAVALTREAGIDLAPTFIPFTPWTTREGYIELLRELVDLELVEAVPPIQLAIRLLVPEGSYLLRLEAFRALVGELDPQILGYRWANPDAEVDALQRRVMRWVEAAEGEGRLRRAIFEGIWRLAHEAAGRPAPALPADLGPPIPAMSEPWYCCAEPTEQQLQSF
ncbi:MAG: radical SAM protein [Gammaproteobacteria bacterium]|nr:radical SAM protein [Gammaproteobacteria bacterium]